MKQRGELERLAGAAVIVTGSAAILDLRHSTNSPAIVNVSSLNTLAAWAAREHACQTLPRLGHLCVHGEKAEQRDGARRAYEVRRGRPFD